MDNNNPKFVEKKLDNEISNLEKINNFLNENWSCPVCEVKMDSQHAFTVHIRQHNPTDHSNTCSICAKQLSSASSLDRHMLIHSGERPFKCRICNMAFTTNGNMHRHMRTHGQDQQQTTDITQDSDNLDLKKKRKKLFGNSYKKPTGKFVNKNIKKAKVMLDNETQDSNSINSSLVSLLSDKVLNFNNDEMTDDFILKSDKLSKNLSKISNIEKDGFLALLQLGQSSVENQFKIPDSQNYSSPETFIDKNSNSSTLPDFSKDLNYYDDTNDQNDYNFKNFVEQNLNGQKSNNSFEKSELSNINSIEDEKNQSKICETKLKLNLDEDSFKENQNNFHVFNNQQSLSLKDLLDQNLPIKNDLISLSLNFIKNQEDIKNEETYKNSLTFKQVFIDPMDENDVKLLESQSQDQQYLCKICHLEVRSVNTLRRHQRLHDAGGQLYTCHYCTYTSLDKSSLIRHLRTHNGERPYQCTICKYAFTTKANCERHVRKCHKNKFNDFSLLVHHHKQKINESNYLSISGLNSKANSKQKNLNSSSNLVEINKNFLASSNMHLVPHIFYEPSSIETNCRYCHVDFSFNRLLRQHLRTMCNNNFTKKPFNCSLCNQGFTNRNNCIRHILKWHEHIPYDQIHSLVSYFDINKLQGEHISQDQFFSGKNKNEFIKKIELFLKGFLNKKQNLINGQNSSTVYSDNSSDTSLSKNSDVLDLSLKSTKKNDQKSLNNLEKSIHDNINNETINTIDLFNKTLSSLIALQSSMIQPDLDRN